jgi:hypothetical protein
LRSRFVSGKLAHMPVEWKYRGRVITAEDIAFLRQFLTDHSGMSRRKLSAKVCEAWQWKQANGALCDMVCRGLLLMLHRAGDRAPEGTAASGSAAGAPHWR